ncbi:MAG: chemotaxis protein CheR, partial [Leptospiraceae bacterium]|nr:chemotaxis protein CheR [Leptospiraceae bacterium]
MIDIQEKEFYVVGIGASAGGLEAIESFFSEVPIDSGLAFIIIQHLSPDYKSLMPEILSKRTPLNIITAEDSIIVKPNHIYLIPRKKNMTIFHGKLQLTEKQNPSTLNLPIDIFLNSLAEDYGEKAIGVILSGTGSDGSRGIRMVKENGGMIISQDPETAQFNGMPQSAISTGVVDFILSPEKMPGKIISFVKHPYIQDKEKSRELIGASEDCITKIILLLKEKFNLDFTFYKNSTIIRRLERRLSINQIERIDDYLEYLLNSKEEQKVLYKELLIGVTKFFRDTESFQYIEKEIIPKIFFTKNSKDEIRVWVVACSTGEEAYSIAILFKEYMLRNNLRNDIKVFATDVDRAAIEYAGLGIYNTSITADVSTERLEQFFTQSGDSYRVKNEIREMIIFATHNIIKDPPFKKIDFLTCRNLLIYFQAALQQKVLSLFHFALINGGIMFLGNSETISGSEDLYEAIDLKRRIFKARDTNVKSYLYANVFKPKLDIRIPIPQPRQTIVSSKNNDVLTPINNKLLKDHVPCTAIVNEGCELINRFGEIGKFLIFPQSEGLSESLRLIITDMIPANLKISFNIAINKALKNKKKVVHNNIKYRMSSGEYILLDIIFSP